MADATIIPFPSVTPPVVEPDVKLCVDCRNAFLGIRGIYCGEFREEIYDERIAAECEGYEP